MTNETAEIIDHIHSLHDRRAFGRVYVLHCCRDLDDLQIVDSDKELHLRFDRES